VWYDLQDNIAENVDEAFYPPNNEVRDLVSFDICYDVMEIRIKTTLSTINQVGDLIMEQMYETE
jgi:hypothetical protein